MPTLPPQIHSARFFTAFSSAHQALKNAHKAHALSSLSLCCAYAVVFALNTLSGTAAAQCEVGVPDYPQNCCNGTIVATCLSGNEVPSDCASIGKDCVWKTDTSSYGCGDVAVEPLEDPSGLNPRVCECTSDCSTKECGSSCGISCGTCPGAFDYCQNNQCMCDPYCVDKVCGDDDCGGSCGTCLNGETCNASGLCDACVPDCSGKFCGDDGCGGSCGSCFPGEQCAQDQASCEFCISDCSGKICGDDGCGGSCGYCNFGETCSSNGSVCEACVPDCTGKTCGDDGCGSSCGTCLANENCSTLNQCEVCAPSCDGKICGADGCGGTCGTCPNGSCNSTGDACTDINCNNMPPDGCCQDSQYIMCTGDQVDVTECGDTFEVCGANFFDGFVGCFDLQDATLGLNDCPAPCVSECTNKVCGDDSCGGSCGTCSGNDTCSASGQCEACVPICDGKECGNDGCGGSCGTCLNGESCSGLGICGIPTRTCTDIPAGGCCDGQTYKQCDDGPLVEQDCPSANAECGARSFGGFAGCWSSDQVAGPSQCPCIPQCDGKQCGANGCGGTCGTCGEGQDCTGSLCLYQACPNLPATRCCSGETLTDCGDTGEVQVNCADRNQYCGWDENASLYGCVDAPNLTDASATRECADAPTCTPDCTDRACGSDGCGGTCGACNATETCEFSTGTCQAKTACSDLKSGGCCIDSATLLSCSSTTDQPTQLTCQRFVENEETGRSENQLKCGYQNGQVACVDAYAPDTPFDADALACPAPLCIPSCYPGDECGADGCGGFCGSCTNGETCAPSTDGTGGTCEAPCVPSCAGRPCGDDGCGGDCGACGENRYCRDLENGDSVCAKVNLCGEITETGCCDGNFYKVCNDFEITTTECRRKNTFCGYNDVSELYQCGFNGGASAPDGGPPRQCPTADADAGVAACVPNCTEKRCGTDGCGGSCGECPSDGNTFCSRAGECIPYCKSGGKSYDFTDVGCCTAAEENRRCQPFRSLSIDDAGYPTRVTTERIDSCANRGGCGWDDEWQTYSCRYNKTIEEMPNEDPSGEHPRVCTPIVCTPQCDGKACGSDGCGGSCGSCLDSERCDYRDGSCRDLCAEQNLDSFGSCNYAQLSFCDNGLPTTYSCYGSEGLCGWNPQLNVYSCGTDGQEDPSGDHPIANPDCALEPGQCGGIAGCYTPCGAAGTYCSATTGRVGECLPRTEDIQNSCVQRCGLDYYQYSYPSKYSLCSCTDNCEEYGNCCSDYYNECKDDRIYSSCGDGQCHTKGGENCATCSEDCGSCTVDEDSFPPWDMPYERTRKETPIGFQNKINISPLDDVLPSPPPYSTQALLSYVPALNVDLAPKGSWTSTRNFNADNRIHAVPGKLGKGIRLFSTATDAQGATQIHGASNYMNWIPDGDLPRAPEPEKGLSGGMSLAMWVKIPAEIANEKAAGLWSTISTADSLSTGRRVCTMPRLGEEEVFIQCPIVNGVQTKIQNIQAYVGRGEGFPLAPDGSCLHLSEQKIENKCISENYLSLENHYCQYKSSCNFKLGLPNACADQGRTQIYVEAECGSAYTQNQLALIVAPSSAGRRLIFSAANESLSSTGSIQPGRWHHVGFTFLPHADAEIGRPTGTTTLYLDGEAVDSSITTALPRIRYTTTNSVNPAVLKIPSDVLRGHTGYIDNLADVDETFIYGRALGSAEMAALARNAAQKLRMTWPSHPFEHIIRNQTGLSGNGATLVPVQAEQLTDQGAPGGPRLLQRDTPALRAEELTYWPKLQKHDLAGLQEYTFMTWLKKRSTSSSKILLQLTEGTNDRLKLEESADTGACNGKGLIATFSDGTLTSSECTHALPKDVWVHLAITQSRTQRQIFIDGALTASSTVSNPDLLWSSSNAEVGLKLGDVDFYWAGIFGSTLNTADLAIWRGQGPAMWLDGATYTQNNQGKVRDLAVFNEENTQFLKPTLWQAGTAQNNPNSNGPFALSKTPLQEITLPANARFPVAPGSNNAAMRPRVFSASARIQLSGAGRYPFVQRDFVSETITDTAFRADINCAQSTAAANLRCQIIGFALVAGPDVIGRRNEMNFSSTYFDLGVASADELTAALSFDGRNVYAAIGAIGAPTGGTLNQASRVSMTSALRVRTSNTVAHSSALRGSVFRISPKQATADVFNLREFRLYPRALSPVELAALTQRNCEDLGCEARGLVCTASGKALPMCGTCAQDQTSFSAEIGSQCIEKLAFMNACTLDSQCATNTCAAGRCLDASGDHALCDSHCAALGRACEASVGGAYQCSTSCLKNFYPTNFYDGPEQACTWYPTREADEFCASDSQCRTGACIEKDEARYFVKEENTCPSNNSGYCRGAGRPGYKWKLWSRLLPSQTELQDNDAFCIDPTSTTNWPYPYVYSGKACPPYFFYNTEVSQKRSRCAFSEANQCTVKNRLSIAKRTKIFQQEEESTTYGCGKCLTTTFDGKPLYVAGWKMLKPEACKLFQDKMTERNIDYRKKDSISFQDMPTVSGLKTLIFKRSGAVTPAEYSSLEKMGFGPSILNYHSTPATQRNTRYRWGYGYNNTSTLLMQDCGNQGLEKNAFFDPVENEKLCVPNKFPNGTQCPPPGYNASSGDSPHAFCDSGFCARDTGVCETGFGILEETDAADRGDNKNNNRSDLGPVAFIQTNRSSMVTRHGGNNTNGAAKKRLYSLSSVNDNSLSFFGSRARQLMRLEQNVLSKPDDNAASYSSKTFLMGVQIPSSASPNASCEGATFSNGSYVAPSSACEAPIAAGKLAASPPVVSLCLPSPASCQAVGPEAFTTLSGKGPMCVQQISFIGPVPITVQAEVTLNVCVGAGVNINSQTYEPAFAVVPSVGIGVDLRGGVGGEYGPVSVFAGVRAVITILQLDFPISWGLKVVNKNRDKNNNSIENLYEVKFQRTITVDITLLKLVLSLFAEVGISIFKVEWDQVIFQFGGFKLSYELASTDIQSKKVDFEHPTANLP